MGWNPFASSSTEPVPVVPKSDDGGYIAPNRSKRELCYDARDDFFDCLDANNIVDAIKNDEQARLKCPKQVEAYEKDCARSWIKYFKEKRVMEHRRDAMIENIKKDDAEARERQKGKKNTGGLFG